MRATAKRAPRSEFSARVRGQIIRAVCDAGEYRGRKGKQEFAIYRNCEGVHLLIAKEERWTVVPAQNTWDALAILEAKDRDARYKSPATSDSRLAIR